MVTRAARAAAAAAAARIVPSAGTKRTRALAVTSGSGRKNTPEEQEGDVEASRGEDTLEDGFSDSELSSVASSQSEFELSDEDGQTVSKYFQTPASPLPARGKRKRVAVNEPTIKAEAAIKKEPSPSLGDIVPAIIKHEQKKKKGGNKKNDPLSTKPPPHWEEMYAAVKEIRGRVPAPVDTMGCERLADGASTPKLRRFQTLISLMLSSQTKDTVNAVAMKQLQTELPGGLCLESILEVEPKRLDELIRIVGFHNRKTEYIKKAAIILRDQYAGEIPDTIEGLTSLPGVGPKMAHLCMSAAWGKTLGIGVDVHVHRITNLWGWVKTNTPEETRMALEAWLPRDRWREINHLLVGFGQSICLPRGRKCGECTLAETGWCRAAWVGVPKAQRRKVVKTVVKDEEEDVKIEVKMEGGIKKEVRAGASPTERKRRKIKVEVKEEEGDDAIIADIEDIIPHVR